MKEVTSTPPAAADRRKAYTKAISGWLGASRTHPSLAGYTPRNADAREDLSLDLPTMRSRSRDLARNSPIAGGAINAYVSNVVGTGLTMQAAIDGDHLGLSDSAASAWQHATEREFRVWAESRHADITRQQNFYQLQSLAFRSALESGDVFALLPRVRRPGAIYATCVQIIEADRICNPNQTADSRSIISGIEIDQYGAPIRYHIADRHPHSYRNGNPVWAAVEAYDRDGNPRVIHLMDRRRPGQVRGVPILASVIEPLKQLSRYTEAELQAAVISGAFSVFIRMDPEAFDSLFDDDTKGSFLGRAKGWDGSLGNSSMSGPGKAINLLPGESVEASNPGRPNSDFDPFVQAILRQIGTQLELPFEVLIKHFTSSYSAARAALLDAWRVFRGRREWLAQTFCQPIYEAWLAEAITLGRVKAPGFFDDPSIRAAWCATQWVGDGPGSIDPLKEVGAARERIELGISTLAAESVLHDGIDWETKHAQRLREKAASTALETTTSAARKSFTNNFHGEEDIIDE
jgi:lambda family phage portal protein